MNLVASNKDAACGWFNFGGIGSAKGGTSSQSPSRQWEEDDLFVPSAVDPSFIYRCRDVTSHLSRGATATAAAAARGLCL